MASVSTSLYHYQRWQSGVRGHSDLMTSVHTHILFTQRRFNCADSSLFSPNVINPMSVLVRKFLGLYFVSMLVNDFDVPTLIEEEVAILRVCF